MFFFWKVGEVRLRGWVRNLLDSLVVGSGVSRMFR